MLLQPAVSPSKIKDETGVEQHRSRPRHIQFSPDTRQSRRILPTPNRADRMTQFGIDCIESIHFKHWEPGGEYVAHLTVKNVIMKTQKIQYKLPQTRYFSMGFPEPVTLSAGMSWTIAVTFRPVAKENYNDVITFSTSLGKFNFPIRATLPEHSVSFPENIDFAYRPVHEIARQTFTLTNTGELVSAFTWSVNEPYQISPIRGVLEAGASCSITVSFAPETAAPYEAIAVCTFGDREQWEFMATTKQLALRGIGKYSYLVVGPSSPSPESGIKSVTLGEYKDTAGVSTHPVFPFGDVFVGKSTVRRFQLRNLSIVEAKFKINASASDADPCFRFSKTTGTVPPEETLDIDITFTPLAPSMHSLEYFRVMTVSGNTLMIGCSGHGIGPKVELSAQQINFGDVSNNNSVMRAISIQNKSNCNANYEFLVESDGLFNIDKRFGTVAAQTTIGLTVKFTPREAINYYRRIYCLVENQDALCLEVIGTGFTETRRPATIHMRHVDKYRQRVLNGLSSYAPEQLDELMKSGAIKSVDGILMPTGIIEIPVHLPHVDTETEQLVLAQYYAEQRYDGIPYEVFVEDQIIDFGSCQRYRMIDSLPLRVTNRSKGKMTCTWIIPQQGEDESPIFTVVPSSLDIGPKSTALFRVQFRPNADGQFYGCEMEAFAYYKSMRSFRLINEETFTPPWCISTYLAGNTFPTGTDSYIPKVTFNNHRVDFPACLIGRAVYRTVRVNNEGDTPVKFWFPDTSSVFSAKPSIGLLAKNESQLIVFRFAPTEPRLYDQSLVCHFNVGSSNAHEIKMKGSGFFPKIALDPMTLCIKPTCVGSVSKRQIVIRNQARIFVYFEWRIPEQLKTFVSIEPKKGMLHPNATLNIQCAFAPQQEKVYALKIPCYYGETPLHDDPDLTVARKRVTLTIIGKGTTGKLECDVQSVSFGPVLVKTPIEREVTLLNPNDCDIHYQLQVRDATVPELPIVSHDTVQLKNGTGVLPARAHCTVKISLCLSEQKHFRFKMYSSLLSDKNATALQKSMSTISIFSEVEPQPLGDPICSLDAFGVYPMVQITDIRSANYTKDLLWDLFSLDALNSALRSEEPDQNSLYDAKTDPFGQPAYEFDFSSGVLNPDDEIKVYLHVQNDGIVPVEWLFQMPNDLEVKFDNWADPGQYTEEQMHQKLIIANQLYTITPKMASLRPGESIQIELSYKHSLVGTHTLPVVFKMKNGPPSWGHQRIIYFTGTTVPGNVPHLHFHRLQYVFKPLPIGCRVPPVQSYWLHNRGLLPVAYRVDTRSLDTLQAENHGFRVLECKTKRGEIAPGASVALDWIFQPLEVKDYQVDVPLYIQGGDTRVVSFRGRGLAPEIDNTLSDTIPMHQHLRVPNQLASLSLERLRFGTVPTSVSLTRLVAVSNDGPNPITFQWVYPDETAKQMVSVQPMTGQLRPGEHRLCRLVFRPDPTPRLYTLSIACHVKDDVTMASYDRMLAYLEQARRERQLAVLDTNTERRTASGGAQKYAPLPAIGSAASEEDKRTNRLRRRRSEHVVEGIRFSCGADVLVEGYTIRDLDETPPPPPPYVMHVSILARTLIPDEFKQKHPIDVRHFTLPLLPPPQSQRAHLSVFMAHIVTDVMQHLLDETMQDRDVSNALQQMIHSKDNNDVSYWLSPRSSFGLIPTSPKSQQRIQAWQYVLSASYNLNLLFRNHQCQSFLGNVFENMLHNMMQEAMHGDFDLIHQPRFVVVKRSKKK